MASPIVGSTGSASTSATNYAPIGAVSFVNIWASTDAAVAIPMPVTTDLTNLYVAVNTAPGVGKSYAFAIMKNGSATGLTVTISGTATSAEDTTNTASFAAGDTISLRAIPTGTPTASSKVWYNMRSSAAGQPLFGVNNSGTSAVTYSALTGRGNFTTDSRAQGIMPTAGTLSNLYAIVSTAPGSGKSKIFNLRLGGVTQALTATVSGTNTAASDTSNSVAVVAGDLVNMQVDVSAAPTNSAARHSLLFTPTVSGDSILLNSNEDTPSTSATEYSPPQEKDDVWTATETNAQLIIGNWLVKKLYSRTNAASGAAKSYTLTIRNNAADSLSINTMTNTTANVSNSINVGFVQGDKMSLEATPTGTPAATRINSGILLNAVPVSSSLSDNNDDNSLDSSKWDDTSDTGVTIAETGGEVKIDFAAVGSGSYGNRRAVALYNMTGDYFFNQLTASGDQTKDLDTVPIQLTHRNNVDYVGYIISFDLILAHKYLAGVDSNQRSDTTYDSAVHKYFKMREASGTTYWDYSTDGISYSNYTSVASPIDVTAIKPYQYAGIWGTAATTTVKFDNFNITPSAGGSPTPLLMLMGMGT